MNLHRVPVEKFLTSSPDFKTTITRAQHEGERYTTLTVRTNGRRRSFLVMTSPTKSVTYRMNPGCQSVRVPDEFNDQLVTFLTLEGVL